MRTKDKRKTSLKHVYRGSESKRCKRANLADRTTMMIHREKMTVTQ